jgi:hypothetical protein
MADNISAPDSNVEVLRVSKTGKDDTKNWEYVTCPSSDMFEKTWQGASINQYKFVGGKTYFMPPDFAAELRRIIAVNQRADLRILQSHPDVKSVALSQGTSGAQFSRNIG